MTPTVSVVMPVFNGEPFLTEALESILSQSYQDFECLVVNDGSTDSTSETLARFARIDSRVHIITQSKRGVVVSLNAGVQAAKGRYIVRMDADDIAVPERFKWQVQLMEQCPEIGISGGWVELFGDRNEIWHHRQHDNHIRNMLLFKTSGFSHSTIIARRELLQRFAFESRFPHVEDTANWVRIALNGKVKFANLPQVLVKYRIHSRQVSEQYKRQQNASYRGIIGYYLRGLGVDYNDVELDLHMLVAKACKVDSLEIIVAAGNWLKKLTGLLSTQLRDEYGVFQERWLKLCENNCHLEGLENILSHYNFSPLEALDHHPTINPQNLTSNIAREI